MFILLTFFHDCINPLPLKRDRIYDNMKKRRPLFFKDSTRSFRSSESLKKSGRGDHVLVRSFSSKVAAGTELIGLIFFPPSLRSVPRYAGGASYVSRVS